MSIINRLHEAAEWLGEEIPANTREIADLEGDVRLDELDLYCVNLMREAADALAAQSSKTENSSQDGQGPVRALSATDTNYTPPQPSDATELVERKELARLIDPAAFDWGPLWPRQGFWSGPIREAAVHSAEEQHANEGHERRKSAIAKADAILALRKPSSAQQTITQLTRELETARKVLTEIRDVTDPMSAGPGASASWLAHQAAASFLSSLSHQDEQG